MKFKAAFFDCDGVLTDDGWRLFCRSLGISNKQGLKWGEQYYDKEITYEQWVQNYEDSFRKNNLTPRSLKQMFTKMKINSEAKELLTYLNKKGVFTAVVSSGLDYYVEKVASILHFSAWRANMHLEFTKEGKFKKFWEKSEYETQAKVKEILKICIEQKIKPIETLFVGDSYNDVGVFKLTGHGVLYRRPWNKEYEMHAWKVIDDLNEIKKIIT